MYGLKNVDVVPVVVRALESATKTLGQWIE